MGSSSKILVVKLSTTKKKNNGMQETRAEVGCAGFLVRQQRAAFCKEIKLYLAIESAKGMATANRRQKRPRPLPFNER